MTFVAPWLWMGLIFWLSSQSTLPSVSQPLLDVLIKKTGHMVLFGILAFLWYRALRGKGMDDSRARRWAFFLTVGYAVIDEVHQGFVPGRGPRVTDVFIDGVGAAFSLRVQQRWGEVLGLRVR